MHKQHFNGAYYAIQKIILTRRSKVDNPEYHKKDMKMAQRIHLYSIVSSIIVVVIAYFIFLIIK